MHSEFRYVAGIVPSEAYAHLFVEGYFIQIDVTLENSLFGRHVNYFVPFCSYYCLT